MKEVVPVLKSLLGKLVPAWSPGEDRAPGPALELNPGEARKALEDPERRLDVLRDPRLPGRLHAELAWACSRDELRVLATNPALDPQAQLVLAAGGDALVTGRLARNPSLTQEAAEVLAWDPDWEVRERAVSNLGVELTPTMPLLLHRWRGGDFHANVPESTYALRSAFRHAPDELTSFLGVRAMEVSLVGAAEFLRAARLLDEETLASLLEGFTGTLEELLELTKELGPDHSRPGSLR